MVTIFNYFGIWFAKDSNGTILATANTINALTNKLGLISWKY